MVATERMTLDNIIKANLHTFDDRDDVAEFIESSFADGLFEDIAVAFEEIRNAEGPAQASAMVERAVITQVPEYFADNRDVVGEKRIVYCYVDDYG